MTRYEPGVRGRAVRAVAEVRAEHPQLSLAAVLALVGEDLDVNPSTLRRWVSAGAEAAHGPVRKALEKTLASDPKLATDRNAALVGLCRMVADQVDMAGSACPVNLTAAYLSAIKDLQRAMGSNPASQPAAAGRGVSAARKTAEAEAGASEGGAGDDVGSVSSLDKLRQARQGTA